MNEQTGHEEARQLAEASKDESNLARAYLECRAAFKDADVMLGAHARLLRRVLPIVSGAGSAGLASEIVECLDKYSDQQRRNNRE